MARSSNPFDPRVLAAVIVVGALALLLLLYAIGAGLDGSRDRDGGAHAASNGLNGYAALATLLERRGHTVDLSRGEARLGEEALLVLTPQFGTAPDELAETIERRRHSGPTLVILPKWLAVPATTANRAEAKDGWVLLGSAAAAEWIGDLPGLDGTRAQLGKAQTWAGLGLSGALPDPGNVVTLRSGPFVPLVRSDGRMLAGYWQDDGNYPVLDNAAGVTGPDPADERTDTEKWAVVVVAEPDLLNNYGMADQTRARAAVALVETAMEGDDTMPILFDLTLAGLGRSENLLTLAFEPPFLAATLCLILAALVVGWRAFRRFGPPVQASEGSVLGKRELAANGAALIQRAGRWHLLGAPYAALVTTRIARQLGLRSGDDAPLMAALDKRGLAVDFDHHITNLRRATRPAELLRAAAGLRTIERTISA